MRKRLLIGAILAVTLGAQGLPPLCRTGGMYNGRMRRVMSFVERTGWAAGYNAAIVYVMYLERGIGKSCLTFSLAPDNSTNIEVAERLDTFYKVPENLPIPIAWEIESMAQRRPPQEEVQYVQVMREHAATLPQEPQ